MWYAIGIVVLALFIWNTVGINREAKNRVLKRMQEEDDDKNKSSL